MTHHRNTYIPMTSFKRGTLEEGGGRVGGGASHLGVLGLLSVATITHSHGGTEAFVQYSQLLAGTVATEHAPTAPAVMLWKQQQNQNMKPPPWQQAPPTDPPSELSEWLLAGHAVADFLIGYPALHDCARHVFSPTRHGTHPIGCESLHQCGY